MRHSPLLRSSRSTDSTTKCIRSPLKMDTSLLSRESERRPQRMVPRLFSYSMDFSRPLRPGLLEVQIQLHSRLLELDTMFGLEITEEPGTAARTTTLIHHRLISSLTTASLNSVNTTPQPRSTTSEVKLARARSHTLDTLRAQPRCSQR